MKAINIKYVKNGELLTANILQERMNGKYGVHTAHENQTNEIFSRIYEEDIYKLTADELKEMGELIAKSQQLLALISSNEVTYFTRVLETAPNFRKKYDKKAILDIVSKEKYNTKETYNLRVKAYAYLLELNVHTCHYIINTSKEDSITVYSQTKTINLLECIWSGMSPEEIKIIFALSTKEYSLLTNSLYKEREEVFAKLGNRYTEWHDTYVKSSEVITAILNERLQGNFNANTANSELDITNIKESVYDLEDLESAVFAAELSVKILFYLKLYPTMAISTLKNQLEELTKKNHVWSDSQLAEIKALGKTKEGYINEIKAILADETGSALVDMKSQMIASICQLNQNSYKMINSKYLGLNPSDTSLTFEEITNIMTLMRTDIKTECIQYMFGMDSALTKSFKQLFKDRITAPKEAEK